MQRSQVFASMHDIILFYSRGNDYTWNHAISAHREEYIDKYYRYVDTETGRRYHLR